MDRWADALGLSPAERAELIELAELAHTPQGIRAKYLALKEAAEGRRAASPATPYLSPAAVRKAARQPFVPDGQPPVEEPVEPPAKEPARW